LSTAWLKHWNFNNAIRANENLVLAIIISLNISFGKNKSSHLTGPVKTAVTEYPFKTSSLDRGIRRIASPYPAEKKTTIRLVLGRGNFNVLLVVN
jgi:hypothetical protein